jgi:hypothetical protein
MAATPEMGSAVTAHGEAITGAMEQWDSGVRFGSFTEAPVDPRMCYTPDAYERLQQVKRQHDPDDVFRGVHPIPCAAAA